jgi:hypothetical protein
MKTALRAIILILISVSVYGQNENPYSVFGYEAPIMPDKTQTVAKLLLINRDSTSSVWMLAVDPSERTITVFDRNKVALQYDTLTNYTMMRWLSPDPYGQFSSPYLAMGNSPHMRVDPDGGWSPIMAGVGFAVGAGVGYEITGDWEWALIGGLAGGLVGGASFNQDHLGATKFNGGFREHGGLRITFNSKLYSGIGNFFSNPSVISGGKSSYFNLLILHDPWKPTDQLYGKWDGHVFFDIDGTDYSFRPTEYRNGKKLDGSGIFGGADYLWHSDGWVGSEPDYADFARKAESHRGYSHTELRVKTTAAKKTALLNNINKAKLDPPDYRFIATRCASFAMRMMRQSNIVPGASRLHQFTPRMLENYMIKRPGVTKISP